MAGLRVVECGLVPYGEAWAMQRDLHARRVAGEIEDTLLLLEHPSVFTAGRRTEAADRPADPTIPVVDVDRGGKITWHGPGQLVGYPIVRLPPLAGDGAARDGLVDVVAHVRRLEEALIGACAELGVATTRVAGRSGVWVQAPGRRDAKVAAIGVRVSREVTTHGFALNCDADLSAYQLVVPCGIRDADVTSLSEQLGRTVTVAEVTPLVVEHLRAVLGAREPAHV